VVIVTEYERGLDYVMGKFQGLLGPGQYYVWPFSGRRIQKVDMREQALRIGGQEVLTSEQVPVRLNILVRFRVTDPEKAVHEVTSYHDALHQAVQLAARDVVVARELEQFLQERSALGEAIGGAVSERATEFGVEVVSASIKDAMLDGELKAAYAAKLTAEQEGQAALIEARHQVAVARARANAAKLLAENPAMFAQKQLDVLEKAAGAGHGNTFVVLPERLADLLERIKPDSNAE